jgi:hypothetical protein
MSFTTNEISARCKCGEPPASIGQATERQRGVSREALSRLRLLDIGELRRQWRALYKTPAPPHLSRELLVRAVAYRLQELALGGIRPEPQRQLLRIAKELKETGAATIRARPELRPGTRLMREWRGRTHEVLVVEDGFSWQGTHCRSLSAIARKITGTAWSGPLFFGLKPTRSGTRRSSQQPTPAGEPVEINDVAS